MAIQFVGGNTDSKVGSTTGTSTIALNSGLTGGIASSVAEGDLVIAAFATGSTANRTLSITDGSNAYTLIDSELYADDSYDTNLRVAYKFMGSTPDTSTTFGPSGSTSDAAAMAVYVFRGVDQTTPLDVAAVSFTGGNFSTVNPPSILPSTAGAFIVCVGAIASNNGTHTLSNASLVDVLSIGSNDTNDISLGIGHKDDWTSGAFDCPAFTWTSSQDSTESVAAMSIALRPAPETLIGSASITEGNDTVAASGTTPIDGDASITESADTLSATGTTPIDGDAAVSEGDDTLSAAGAIPVNGQAAIAEADDTLSSSGTAPATGSASIAEGDDTVTATGELIALDPIAGEAAIAEGNDTVAGAGVVLTSGAAAITESDDTVSAAGAIAITGQSAVTESDDDLSATGSGLSPIAGEASVAEGDDTLEAAGSVTDPVEEVIPAGGGGGGAAQDEWWRSPPEKKKRRKASKTDTGAPIKAPLSVSEAARRAAEEAAQAERRAEAARAAAIANAIEAERQRVLAVMADDELVLLLAA